MAALAFFLGVAPPAMPAARLERERVRKLHRLRALLDEIAPNGPPRPKRSCA